MCAVAAAPLLYAVVAFADSKMNKHKTASRATPAAKKAKANSGAARATAAIPDDALKRLKDTMKVWGGGNTGKPAANMLDVPQPCMDLLSMILTELKQLTVSNGQIVQQLKQNAADAAQDKAQQQVRSNTAGTTRLAKQMYAEQPYPEDSILRGGALQLLGVGSMQELVDKTGSDQAAIKLVQGAITKIMDCGRSNVRGKMRAEMRYALCHSMDLHPVKSKGKKGIEWPVLPNAGVLLGDGPNSITGGGTYDTEPLLCGLLAMVNCAGGTSMAQLGAGGKATKVSTGLVAYAVLEMTRYAQNEVEQQPAAGSAGNTIGQAGDRLKGEWEKCHEALLAAATKGTCKLELANKVILGHSESLGQWRKLDNTIQLRDKLRIDQKQ